MRTQNGIARLSFFEEAVGSLHELTLEESLLVARIGSEILALPPEMEGKLKPFLKHRIGILRTDIPGKEYLVRVIHEKGPNNNLGAISAEEVVRCRGQRIANRRLRHARS
jgi:hypothetical protein